MSLRLGVSVIGLAAPPLDAEIVGAIASSRIVETLELSPILFPGGDNDPGRKLLIDAVAASPRLSIPTFHATFGQEFDLSQTDAEMRRNAIDRLIADMKAARDFDAETIVVHPSSEPIDEADRPARIKALKISLSEIEERLRRYGMRMALELLPRTCLGRTPEELLDFVGDFGDEFGFCLDANHLTNTQDRLCETVRLLAPRLYDIHVSDYFGGDECHNLPGNGTNDWRAFRATLEEVGYTGPFTYELSRRIADTPVARLRAIEENFSALFA